MKRWLLLAFSLPFLRPLLAAQAVPRLAPAVEVSLAKASPSRGGWYPWYEIHVDPQDVNHLIVCGSHWEARENALYGFVYFSMDGGRNWKVALEDKNSTWVSEHSCAFGLAGRAYFVSEASKIIDGHPHHDEGVTRIFVSSDAGQTWAEGARTTWADYSASVVDLAAGPDQNRLFTFFNTFFTKLPEDAEERVLDGTRIGLFSYQRGEKQVEGPFSAKNMAAFRYHGSFPQKALFLKDGSLVCMYRATLHETIGIQIALAAVRMSKDRERFDLPVTIARNSVDRKRPCFIGDSEAYDESRNRIYVAFHDPRSCELMLTYSDNGARTWSVPRFVRVLEARIEAFDSPSIAVNGDGVLGLLWHEKPGSDCWYFAHSDDGGETFSVATPLSHACYSPSLPRLSSTFFWTFVTQAGSQGLDSPAVVEIRNSQDQLWRSSSSLAASSDGAFHAVWVEPGNEGGQLRAASLLAGDLPPTEGRPIKFNSRELSDVSTDVAVLFGGNQDYDWSSSTLSLSLVFRNKSNRPIQSPAFLRLESLGGELEKMKMTKFGSGDIDGKVFWDLSGILPNGVLNPGEQSRPFSFSFRLAPNENMEASATKLASLRMRVFVRVASGDVPHR